MQQDRQHSHVLTQKNNAVTLQQKLQTTSGKPKMVRAKLHRGVPQDTVQRHGNST